MASETSFHDIQLAARDISVRKIRSSDLLQSLRKGIADFNARPSFGVFLAIVYPLFALLLTLALTGENLLFLAFPMIAGLTLLGPMVSVAIFEMSRRREQGLDVSWRSSFSFVHSSAFASIVALSIVMAALYVAWLFMAEFIYSGLFTIDAPTSPAEFWSELMTTRRGGALIFYGNAVGLVFSITALAISVVAFPLLLDRPVTSISAMAVSIRAFATNSFVLTLWGLMVVALLALGSVFFLVGLAAVLPILGHATWHLYRRLIE